MCRKRIWEWKYEVIGRLVGWLVDVVWFVRSVGWLDGCRLVC